MPDPIRGYTDLSSRTKLRLTGEDRVRYLNGQVTNDVRKATATDAMYAGVTTAKGKLEADVYLSPTPEGDAIWVDGPGSIRDELLLRLDKYLISDDAEWEDVSDDWQLIHVLGESPQLEGIWSRHANRFGVPGADLIATVGTDIVGQLDLEVLPDSALLDLRIRQGMPVWGAELDTSILPQEALLQDRAIDFGKGCYIGQEVISRIKSVGKVNRQLVALVAQDATKVLEPGMELLADETVVGHLTSVTESEALGCWIALGFAKRDFSSPGQVLVARSEKNNLSSTLEIRETPLT